MLYIDLVVNVYIIPTILALFILYKISVDTVLLLCYTRMRVIYIIMCIVLSSSAIIMSLLYCYKLLQIVTLYLLTTLLGKGIMVTMVRR